MSLGGCSYPVRSPFLGCNLPLFCCLLFVCYCSTQFDNMHIYVYFTHLGCPLLLFGYHFCVWFTLCQLFSDNCRYRCISCYFVAFRVISPLITVICQSSLVYIWQPWKNVIECHRMFPETSLLPCLPNWPNFHASLLFSPVLPDVGILPKYFPKFLMSLFFAIFDYILSYNFALKW